MWCCIGCDCDTCDVVAAAAAADDDDDDGGDDDDVGGDGIDVRIRYSHDYYIKTVV